MFALYKAFPYVSIDQKYSFYTNRHLLKQIRGGDNFNI
jgi:hypothetical protein